MPLKKVKLSGLQVGTVKAMSCLPMRALYLLSTLFSPVLEYVLKYRRNTVENNIRNSFPEKNEAELRTIRKQFYRNFTDLSFEICKALHWDSRRIMKRIQMKNEELLLELAGKGHPVLVAMGHCGNWEWLNAYGTSRGIPVFPVYKELNDPAFNSMFLEMRKRLGSYPIPMKKTYRKVKELVDKDRPGLFCFLTDQCPTRHELEFWTGFLNQETPVFLGIEKLARRFGLPVLFLAMHRLKRGYYEAEFILLSDTPTLTQAFELTKKHVQLLELQIQTDPPNWLWSHRRWKFSREDMLKKRINYGVQKYRG